MTEGGKTENDIIKDGRPQAGLIEVGLMGEEVIWIYNMGEMVFCEGRYPLSYCMLLHGIDRSMISYGNWYCRVLNGIALCYYVKLVSVA